LPLNGRSALKLDGVGAELDCLFDDAAAGVFVAEDITKGEFSDHGDLVILEVMAELAGCD
jgi:hypothetical protein